METITINPLGDTPKEQWTTAIGIYAMALRANIEDGNREKSLELLGAFEDEMKRLAANL